MKAKPKVGPPFKPVELVKIPVGLKLPRWLVEWLQDAGPSKAFLIEQALCEKHKLTPPKVKK